MPASTAPIGTSNSTEKPDKGDPAEFPNSVPDGLPEIDTTYREIHANEEYDSKLDTVLLNSDKEKKGICPVHPQCNINTDDQATQNDKKKESASLTLLVLKGNAMLNYSV